MPPTRFIFSPCPIPRKVNITTLISHLRAARCCGELPSQHTQDGKRGCRWGCSQGRDGGDASGRTHTATGLGFAWAPLPCSASTSDGTLRCCSPEASTAPAQGEAAGLHQDNNTRPLCQPQVLEQPTSPDVQHTQLCCCLCTEAPKNSLKPQSPLLAYGGAGDASPSLFYLWG